MKSLFKLKPYIQPYWKHLAVSMALAIPLAAIRVAPAPLVQKFVDEILIRKDTGKLYIVPLVFIALYLANFVIRFLHFYLVRLTIIGVHTKIKRDLFSHLMGLSAEHFTEKSTGNLISRVGSDPQHIDGGIASITLLLREPIVFISLFTYAFYLNWKLTLIVIVTFPFLAWLLVSAAKKIKGYALRVNEKNADIFARLQENFTGFRVIKTFGLEKHVNSRFEHEMDSYADTLRRNAKLEELTHPAIDLINAFAIAAVIYFGGTLVLSGELTQGQLISFFTAFAIMADPIRRMNDVNIKLNVASAASERIFDLLSWRPKLKRSPNPQAFNELKSEIEVDNVSFAYPDEPERWVLRDVSFRIPKGSQIALVGQSGSGKTTLSHLLPRLYDVTGGCIRIDGTDIRLLNLDHLRSQIAVVSQDIFLFNDSITENIRCGNLHSTDEEVREAARQANALEFIERLPQKFSTVIGDRGQKLSGGERQRLSIARAFLRKAPILVLDEATSNLDSASEKAVQDALDSLMKDRTSLVIAHRLSTIRNANLIVVFKEGRVVEMGEHEELLKKNGEYALFQKINMDQL